MKFAGLIVLAMLLAIGGASAKAHKTKVERSQEADAPAQGYDGAWTIEAVTTVGECGGLVPESVTIRNNQIAEAAGSPAPWGYVEGDGTFVARFTNPSGQLARAQGKLTSQGGSGAWSSNTAMCGGTWRALRNSASRAAQ